MALALLTVGCARGTAHLALSGPPPDLDWRGEASPPSCSCLTRSPARGILRACSSPTFVGPALSNLAAPRCSVVTAKVNGLVGDCAPLGYFDPLGFSKGASPETMKKCAAPPQAA